MAILYILSGMNHFGKPKFYNEIIPPDFRYSLLLNKISGSIEVILGVLLCIPQTSKVAAFGIIAMLLTIFPANIFMYQTINKKLGIPKWILILRLPLQIFLIIWAYQYTSLIK